MPIAPAVGAALIGSAGAIGGGLIASSGAKSAAKRQERAAQEATAAQTAAADKQIALQEPFRQGGLTAQSRIFELLGLQDPNARAAPSADFGKYGRDFGTADFEADPGYAFRQSEGMKALERSAAARGNLLSGSTMKGIQRFGQDLASQEYTNAFNRYQVNRSNQLNPLQSLMGAGQSATNVQTGVEGQLGQNQATNLYNAGAARASGYVGSANALSGALNSIGQTAAMYPTYQAQNKFTEAQTNALNRGDYGGGMFPPTYYPRGTPYNPGYDAYAGVKG
jgi:hypothetical protein